MPKKNGKTEMLAALALWFMLGSGEPSPWVVCAAGSDEQADLLFGAARTMVEESPTLSKLADTGEELIVPRSHAGIPGGRLQRVAASARKFGSNLDGKNLFVVICDELHVWEGDRARVVWGTLTRGVVTRREPMILQITTAGFDRESICYEQYQHALKVIHDPTFDPHFFGYVCEAGEKTPVDDMDALIGANPSYGQIMDGDFYEDQLTKQPENEYRRFFRNEWTRSEGSWLPAGAWEACVGDATIPEGSSVWVGVDVALYHDNTAVAVAWPRDDGKTVVQVEVWEPDEDKIDVAEVMEHIRALSFRYKVREVAYDPRFFDVPAQMLMDEGIPMVEIPQSVERMVPACGHAYTAIAAGDVVHDGDPVLEEHVLSAAQRPGERGWTLSKGKSKHVIDGCIAMVLALWRSVAVDEDSPLVMEGALGA
jgi:phage terminase large subunit-like protein|tara:strand:+ start:703 stop:1977 length:1275 start_codon:yes stop_codon:yes gene_type:complete